jgi:ribosomal protein S14
MKRKVKWFILERVKRINFVKTELNRLVGKSLFKNTYNKTVQSVAVYKTIYHREIRFNTISNFRLYCMLNLSPKLVNKKFRLSRFSMNALAKGGNIQGFVNRGW